MIVQKNVQPVGFEQSEKNFHMELFDQRGQEQTKTEQKRMERKYLPVPFDGYMLLVSPLLFCKKIPVFSETGTSKENR